jgi:hypothetical protein
MRQVWAKYVLAVGVIVLSQGCKRQPAPAPAQTGGSVVPRAIPAPNFDPLPIEDSGTDTGRLPQVRHRRRIASSPVAPAPVVVDNSQADAQAAEQRQREEDEKLLKEQEAASQKQQQELDKQVQESQKILDQQQAEPRIQDAPSAPPAQPQPEPQI